MAKKKAISKKKEIPVPSDNEGRVNFLLRIQRQNDIIAMLLEGKEEKTIKPYVVTKYKLTHGSAHVYISEARKTIKERLSYELDTLIAMHINRYERIYEALRTIGADGIAMTVLHAKEKLMGFHKEGFHMRVTSGQVSQVSSVLVNNEYDVMKLGTEKIRRMKKILDKLKEKNKK